MTKNSSLTIIDNADIRGVVAPARHISKELLENLIDLIELSSEEFGRETTFRIAKADRSNSWIPLKEAKRRFAKSFGY